MVGAPLDTTRADRGGAAAPVDRGGVLRRFLRSAGEPKSVTNIADRSRATSSATTATFADADSQAWTPPTWEEIVSTHSGRVYRLAYRLTGNQHDAEDLTQEVFVRVFRSLSTYTPGTFEGWLHRITTNLFLDMVRRRQRIRFDALGDDAAERLPSREPYAPTGLQRRPLRRRRTAGARHPGARVPCGRRPVRHRGTLVRGDRRHPRSEARHRPQPDPPRPLPPAQGPSAPLARSPRRAAARARGGGARSSRGGRRGDGVSGTSPTPAEQHLGDRLAALVDGELNHDARERVLSHLATCAKCKAEADAQRRLKSVFAQAAPPPPSEGFLARLQGLPGGPAGPGGDDDGSGGPLRPRAPGRRVLRRARGAESHRGRRGGPARAPWIGRLRLRPGRLPRRGAAGRADGRRFPHPRGGQTRAGPVRLGMARAQIRLRGRKCRVPGGDRARRHPSAGFGERRAYGGRQQRHPAAVRVLGAEQQLRRGPQARRRRCSRWRPRSPWRRRREASATSTACPCRTAPSGRWAARSRRAG